MFDFEPQVFSWAYELDNLFGTKKIREVGQSFWDGESIEENNWLVAST
jgi:hypothetical protein